MQVKVNRVVVMNPDGSQAELSNIDIIQGGNGLYVEHEVVIGKDNDGNNLKQKRFTLYPWEKVLLMEWNEPTLIEQVKEFVILTELEDFADLLEELQEELEDAADEKPAAKGENPYDN